MGTETAIADLVPLLNNVESTLIQRHDVESILSQHFLSDGEMLTDGLVTKLLIFR